MTSAAERNFKWVRDVLVGLALAIVVGVNWREAAPDEARASARGDGRLTARYHLTLVHDAAAGTRITDDDVEDAFGRVADADSLARRRIEVVGRFTTRPVRAGAPLYESEVTTIAPALTDTAAAIFPVVVRRGVVAAIAAGALVVFVRDSAEVVDAGIGKPPYRGFPVLAVVPTPEDTQSAAILVRAPVARVEAMRRLTGTGWHPVVVARQSH